MDGDGAGMMAFEGGWKKTGIVGRACGASVRTVTGVASAKGVQGWQQH